MFMIPHHVRIHNGRLVLVVGSVAQAYKEYGSMNRLPSRLASKPPSPAGADLEQQRTDVALLSLARVLASIAIARSATFRVGGSHAA